MSQQRQSWAARLVVILPYAWLLAFFLAPFLIVLKISLSQTALAQPPYLPVFDLAGGFRELSDFLLLSRPTITGCWSQTASISAHICAA